MKVENMKYLLFVLLLVVVLITAGCTSGNQNVVAAPTATPSPTITTIPTIIQTPIQTIISTTVTPDVTIIKNVTVKPTVIPDTTIIDDIVFLTFADRFVSIKYPNTWTVEATSEHDLELTRLTNNKLVNQVTIYNPGKTVAYNITTWDIGVNAWRISDQNDWVYDQVRWQFPEYDPKSITGIDRKCLIDNIHTCLKQTVTIPNKAKLFKYWTVTLRYGYAFELSSSDATTYDAYKNLGEYMTNTVKISDTRTT